MRYDPETDLYWMSVRAYDPTLGRFISHDPLGRLAAQGQDTQPYVYAGDNPVNNTDPAGMMYAPPPGGGGSGGGGSPSKSPSGTTPLNPCNQSCLRNGNLWKNYLAAFLNGFNSVGLAASVFDLVKWIVLGVAAIASSTWAVVVQALTHIARDGAFILDFLNRFTTLIPDSWMGVIHVIEIALDFITPIVDILSSIFSFGAGDIARKLVMKALDNPMFNLAKRWGEKALASNIINWITKTNIPWFITGSSTFLSTMTARTFCFSGSTGALCHVTFPGWLRLKG